MSPLEILEAKYGHVAEMGGRRHHIEIEQVSSTRGLCSGPVECTRIPYGHLTPCRHINMDVHAKPLGMIAHKQISLQGPCGASHFMASTKGSD
jgi:hypothetical protein